MPVSYRPLWITLAERGLKKGFLKEPPISLATSTLAKLGKNEPVALEVIERICLTLGIPIEKVVGVVKKGEDSATSG
jgi:DNA-binding Xre family transcriptional regulator